MARRKAKTLPTPIPEPNRLTPEARKVVQELADLLAKMPSVPTPVSRKALELVNLLTAR